MDSRTARTSARLPCLTFAVVAMLVAGSSALAAERPNFVLIMADDQGWGETGYYNHPVLKTPNLDAMAQAGLRFDRFYAGAPNCSPTRSSFLTGRSNDRCGVFDHGYPLCLQERTLAQALRDAGYATGHFGKWHLNGFAGPGAPVLADDPRNPGRFGFDEWLSVTNFFDLNPLMSHRGEFEEFEGDSSEIVVDEAIRFIRTQKEAEKPFLAVVWYGTPHSPFRALEKDKAQFAGMKEADQNHFGELVAMDRSIGTMRQALRDMAIAENTLFWFCSDNGGLIQFGQETVGGLRGGKGNLYEGGLRVPAIIEWPGGIKEPRVTLYPAATMDIFPTLVDIVGLPRSVMLDVHDGTSLKPLLAGEIGPRKKPLPFRHGGRVALIDNEYKLIAPNKNQDTLELYNLDDDPNETTDLMEKEPEVAARLTSLMRAWDRSVDASIAGHDYPEGRVTVPNPERRDWMQDPSYAPYLEAWRMRPEYRARIEASQKRGR